MPFTIRDAADADIGAITAIYAHAVLHGRASFETEAPDEAEIARRRAAIVERGMPYLVADETGAGVAGYAYAGPYRARPAYRFSVENSIYVAPGRQGGGIGRALLEALIARCEAGGFRLMVAVIGDSANAASIRLHARCGFAHAGVLPSVGWKHGQWLDTVLMTRPLGLGNTAPPP
ncbi:MAG: N-acetyltransferase [Proteobacteria bacterium]|nr:N-acetyltransferase [Pseudomonadota bacterium]